MFRELITKLRFKRYNYTDRPFYDKKLKTYRCFFEDRIEEGPINYVVSEYIRDGLIYCYHIYFNEYHEHSFTAVLDAILRCNGEGFIITKENECYYSKQELNMIRKYCAKLNKDNSNWEV